MYVPSALPVHDPVTLREPVIPTFLQLVGSRPANEISRFPLSFRHDDVTFQAPTTLPAQAVTFGQDAPPPVPVVPPVPAAPLLEVPPVPDTWSEGTVQAPESIPNAMAIVRTAD
jgi:hypothetical protein